MKNTIKAGDEKKEKTENDALEKVMGSRRIILFILAAHNICTMQYVRQIQSFISFFLLYVEGEIIRCSES